VALLIAALVAALSHLAALPAHVFHLAPQITAHASAPVGSLRASTKDDGISGGGPT